MPDGNARATGAGVDMHPDLSVALEALEQRSPEDAWRARRLAQADERVRAICEDYAEALQAMERWQQGDEASEERAQEFRRIVIELEEELIQYLGESNRRRSG
jgi:hypothetical protein